MKYTHIILTLFIVHCTLFISNAQVAINTDHSNPDSSAILDVKSTNKGFLYPRMTTVERDAINSPTVGLTIFNLDDNCTDIYDGDTWMKDCPLVLVPDSLINPWTKRTDFLGTGRLEAVGFSINDKGYIGTGLGSNGYEKDFWEYDPDMDSWTQKTDFPGTIREGAVGFSINGKGYIGTGFDITFNRTKDFWEYDPNTNSWTQKTDFPGTPREEAVGFSINGKGYIGTGLDGSYKKDFWEYDPVTDTWTQKTDFPGTPRGEAVGFSINGKGYIGTGDDGSYKKDFWEYDPVTDTWTQKTDFPGTPREDAVGFSMNGKGYIGTGDSSSGRIKDFWEYDPVTDTWTRRADFLGTSRSSAVSFSINDKAYVSTGSDASSRTKDIWEYDSSPSPIYQSTLPSTGTVINSVIRDGDNDTKIQVEESADEDMIRFDVAGNQAMIIQNDGKVGIEGNVEIEGNVGIDISPLADYPLTIRGDTLSNFLRFQHFDGTDGWHIREQGTDNQDLGFTESGVADHRLVLEAGGNVGIGVENPDTKLHLVGNIKMVDGNEANGKVLVSDANGVGRWASNCKAYGDGSAGDLVISTAVDWSVNPPTNGNYMFDDLTITATGSLTVPSGTVIMVANTFSNAGTITVQAGIPGTRFVTNPNGPFPRVDGQTLSHRFAYAPEQLRFLTNPKLKGGSNGATGGFVGPTTVGGDGGGTIVIRAANQIVNTGTINALGGNAPALPSGAAFPGSGGGGGGFVILSSQTINQTGTISVKGGDGGDAGDGDNNQGGGGGGGGVIHLIASNAGSVGGTLNVTGGTSGSSAGDGQGTSSGGDGGASGGNGGTGGDFIFSTSTTIPATNGDNGVVIRTQIAEPCNLAFDH